MSDEKHTVSTDALTTLGTIIGEGCGRDAIHLAVEPVEAFANLQPGEHVGFVPDRAEERLVAGTGYANVRPVGIVDPFLKGGMKKGQRFWLVVYPRQITSLRHVWTHPAFPNVDAETVRLAEMWKQAEAQRLAHDIETFENQQWFNNFARGIGVQTEELVEAARQYLKNGTEWNDKRFNGSNLPDEFWDHYEAVTGTKVPMHDRGDFFPCCA